MEMMEMAEASMSLAVTINLPHNFFPPGKAWMLEAETLALLIVVSFLLAHHMTRLSSGGSTQWR